MTNAAEAQNTINGSDEEQIPIEYQNTRERPFTPYDFAEIVTPETKHFFLMRLAKESKDKQYQQAIITVAAETLKTAPEKLLGEFRTTYLNNQNAQGNSINKRGPFRFLPVSDLYNMSSSTDWLIKSYLDKGTLAMLFGKSGTYKSFCAIDMGLSIATGSDWHGNPVSQGKVFYICGEGQKGISRRIRAWEIHYGIPLDNVDFFTSDRPAQFLDEESALDVVNAVSELCDQNGMPALIIIDTLNRNFGTGDENSTTDMTRFINVIDKYLRIQYNCTVLIVHHAGLKDTNRARGASALHAALDWVYQAEVSREILELYSVKSKDHELSPFTSFIPLPITLDWNEDDGSPMTSVVLKNTANKVGNIKPLSAANKIAYDTLKNIVACNAGKSMDLGVWREAAYQAGISPTGTPDANQKAFLRAKKYLEGMRLVETKDGYLWNIAMTTPDTGHTEDIQGTLSVDIKTDRQGHPP
jgi:hypothetical protein